MFALTDNLTEYKKEYILIKKLIDRIENWLFDENGNIDPTGNGSGWKVVFILVMTVVMIIVAELMGWEDDYNNRR